jgi:hypothetical protein
MRFAVMYIKRKGSIAGPAFKIPLMGPFLQALDPKFDAYLAQWASGPLSCVSVFHKYVFLPLPICTLQPKPLVKMRKAILVLPLTQEARKRSGIKRALKRCPKAQVCLLD